jgi:hypothetical protein
MGSCGDLLRGAIDLFNIKLTSLPHDVHQSAVATA